MSQAASLGGANVAKFRDIPFNAAHFTGVGGPGGGTWTVDSGDVVEWKYAVSGEIGYIRLRVTSTQITVADVDAIQVVLPFNTASSTVTGYIRMGTGGLTVALGAAGGGYLLLARDTGADITTGALEVIVLAEFPLAV